MPRYLVYEASCFHTMNVSHSYRARLVGPKKVACFKHTFVDPDIHKQQD